MGIKAVILAGGQGSRLAEETSIRPKPMVEIGGKPILWHIMKIYSQHDINEFVICLGYKGYAIKEYFASYFLHTCDVTLDLQTNSAEVHAAKTEPWRVTLVDTGDATLTGGRLKRALRYVQDDPFFCMTYGDGVGNIDITASIAHHRKAGKLATVTGTQPPGRFGTLDISNDMVTGFMEKPVEGGGWINGGFFVLSPRVGDYIAGDQTIWEREPLENLAREQQLSVYRHAGYWQPMDSLRDKLLLQQAWDSGTAPWKSWS